MSRNPVKMALAGLFALALAAGAVLGWLQLV